MESATLVADGGKAVSLPGYKTFGWYKVSVPTTIIAGLLANKVYDFDPFYDMKLREAERLKARFHLVVSYNVHTTCF